MYLSSTFRITARNAKSNVQFGKLRSTIWIRSHEPICNSNQGPFFTHITLWICSFLLPNYYSLVGLVWFASLQWWERIFESVLVDSQPNNYIHQSLIPLKSHKKKPLSYSFIQKGHLSFLSKLASTHRLSAKMSPILKDVEIMESTWGSDSWFFESNTQSVKIIVMGVD
jgi:hypothetical protein